MPRKAKRLASWRDGNKRIESSFHQDIADIDLWDDEIEEKEKEEREKDATSATPKEEDWDAPEVQTEPGNGLTWDDMIQKDHEEQPTWVIELELELVERSLPWRRDPEGTWFRDITFGNKDALHWSYELGQTYVPIRQLKTY